MIGPELDLGSYDFESGASGSGFPESIESYYVFTGDQTCTEAAMAGNLNIEWNFVASFLPTGTRIENSGFVRAMIHVQFLILSRCC